MGTVYEAIDLRLQHAVAVKRMTAEGIEAMRAFEQEAQLLASLRHSGLPSVIDYFVERDGRFLVMQYIEGEDLEKIRRRHGGVCARADVLGWAADLLTVLAFLHRYDPPVVHRDIKPANIKLTPKGDIVLVDFGLAKSGHLATTQPPDAGEPRSVYGFTPSYAPPEQQAGTGTDGRSDLYAVGATLYHLLTGVMPAAANQRVAAIASGSPDPLQPAHLINRGVGASLSAIVARAMSLSVHDRFQSAEEMRSALAVLPSLDHQEARGRELHDERRVDAAMPSEAQVGTTVDLIVQVRFAGSPLLGLEDWPGKRAPDSIEQASESLHVTYPTDPHSGRELPARLRVKIVAPDFTVNGTGDCLIEVPPAEYSKRLAFLLTPHREGVCRAHVEVYASDSLHLGTVPLEITASPSATAGPDFRVAQLVLRMGTRELLRPEARPMVPSRTGIAVALPSPSVKSRANSNDIETRAPVDQSIQARRATPPRASRWVAVGAPLAVLVIGAVLVWQTGPMSRDTATVVTTAPRDGGTAAGPPPLTVPPTSTVPAMTVPPAGTPSGVVSPPAPGQMPPKPPAASRVAAEAPPPAAVLKAAEALVKANIMRVLERYRVANEARDFNAVREVWPGVHPDVENMLASLSGLQFEFAEDPKVELQLPENRAIVQVRTRITETRGREKRSRDTMATIVLNRVDDAKRWVIVSVVHKRAD